MVSRPTRGTSHRLTASSPTSRTVDRACSSDGSLQTIAMMQLLLVILQQRGSTRPRLVVECEFQSPVGIAPTDLTDSLGVTMWATSTADLPRCKCASLEPRRAERCGRAERRR
jgi:hypothetical protein